MSLTPKVTGAPAAIWLVYGDLDHDDKHSNFPEVTWCEDAQLDSDVMYVRADLTGIEQLKAENERLRAALKPMTEGTHWITDEEVENARKALEEKA